MSGISKDYTYVLTARGWAKSVEVHARSTQRPVEMQTWAQVAGGLSESQQHHRGLHPSTLIYVREDLLPQPDQPAPMQVDQGSASRHIAGSIDSTGHSDDAPAVWVAQLAPKDSVAIYRAILTLVAPMASVQKCCSRRQQMEVRSKFAKLAKLRRHHAAQCYRPPWCSSMGCCAPCDPDGPFEVLVCEGPKCMEKHYEDRMAWHRGCLPIGAFTEEDEIVCSECADALEAEQGGRGRGGRAARGDDEGGQARDGYALPAYESWMLGTEAATRAALAEALNSGAYSTEESGLTEHGQVVLVATFDGIDKCFSRLLKSSHISSAGSTVGALIREVLRVQKNAFHQADGMPPDTNDHHDAKMYTQGWWATPGSGRPTFCVKKTEQSCVFSTEEGLPADGHAAADMAYPHAPVAWSHEKTPPYRRLILGRCAKLLESADALVSALTSPTLYKHQRNALIDHYRLCTDELFPGVHTAVSQYVSGPLGQAEAWDFKGTNTKLDAVESTLLVYRNAITKHFGTVQLPNVAVSSWTTKLSPAEYSEGSESWQSGVYGCSDQESAGATTSGKQCGAKNTVAVGSKRAAGKVAEKAEPGSSSAAAGSSEAKPIGMHQDTLDFRYGLSSIWAHSSDPTEGGIYILTRAGEEAGSYPSTRSAASAATANARSGTKGFEGVLVNPHKGGGSYVRAYLGRGGCWHAGVQLTAPRSASIHYTGTSSVTASGIARAAGTEDPTSLIWSQSTRERMQGVALLDDDAIVGSLPLKDGCVLTAVVPASAVLPPPPLTTGVRWTSDMAVTIPTPSAVPHGLPNAWMTVVLAEDVAAKLRSKARFQMRVNLQTTTISCLKSAVGRALGVATSSVLLRAEQHMAVPKAAAGKKFMIALEAGDLGPAAMMVARYHCRGAVLTTFLRMLRWDVADLNNDATRAAIKWMFEEGAQSFAPATHPFLVRAHPQAGAQTLCPTPPTSHRSCTRALACGYRIDVTYGSTKSCPPWLGRWAAIRHAATAASHQHWTPAMPRTSDSSSSSILAVGWQPSQIERLSRHALGTPPYWIWAMTGALSACSQHWLPFTFNGRN